MENGFKPWFQNQQIDPNSQNRPFSFQHRLNVPSLGNTFSPTFTFTAAKPHEPCDWVNGSIHGSTVRPIHEVQKKFLVFDQSNDRKTTLIYTSNPIPYRLNFDPKIEKPGIENRDSDTCFQNPFLDDKSEMHEDTEELKALLYSDSDDYYSDDEVSTGHSPVTINGFDRNEEIASSIDCRKRRKLDDTVGYDVISIEDTASSRKSGVNCSGEGEFSCCRSSSGAGIVLPENIPAGMLERKEKAREIINILENLIPGGKNGKDAMVVIDEAINYLRILKVKAKALGLDSV